MRFTLPKLFLAVTLAAVACAGLLAPTPWCVSFVVTFTWAMFAYAALRAIVYSGRKRGLALAFASIGCAYLLLAICSFSSVGSGLVTNYSIAFIARVRLNQLMAGVPLFRNVGIAVVESSSDLLAPEVEADLSGGTERGEKVEVPAQFAAEPWPLNAILMMATSDSVEDNERLLPIKRIFLVGHCVWSWLIALGAACLAGRMHEQRSKPGGPAGNSPNLLPLIYADKR